MNRCDPHVLQSTIENWKQLTTELDAAKKMRETARVCRPLILQLGSADVPYCRAEMQAMVASQLKVMDAWDQGIRAEGLAPASRKLQEVGYLLFKEQFHQAGSLYEKAPYLEQGDIVNSMLRTVSSMDTLCEKIRYCGREMGQQARVSEEVLCYHHHQEVLKKLGAHCAKDVGGKSLPDRALWNENFWKGVDYHRVKVLKVDKWCKKKHCAQIIDLAFQKRNYLFGSTNYSTKSIESMEKFLAVCPEGIQDGEYVKKLTWLRLNFGEDVALFPSASPYSVSRAYQELKKAKTQSAAKFVYLAYLILHRDYRGVVIPGKIMPVWTPEEAKKKAEILYAAAQKLLREPGSAPASGLPVRELGARGSLGYKTAANQDSRVIRLAVENMLLKLRAEKGDEDSSIEGDLSCDEEPVRKKARVEPSIALPIPAGEAKPPGSALEERKPSEESALEHARFTPFQAEVQPSDEKIANIPIVAWRPQLAKMPRDTSVEREGSFEHEKQLQEDAKREIGRWGEEAVYTRLYAHYQGKIAGKYPSCELKDTPLGFQLLDKVSKRVPVEVIWHNKDKSLDKDWCGPYDLTIKKPTKERLIEVKTTASSSYRGIHLSGREYQEMMSKKERYSIFRVFHAGKPDASLEKIKNPAQHFSGQLGCNPPGRILSLQIELP